MTLNFLTKAALALALCGGAAAIPAYASEQSYVGGPGIAMAGSQNYSALPKAARHFIEKHFKGVKVSKCEQYFAKHKYEVELANGIDIEFDESGKVVEIDSPDSSCLPVEVVKNVVHGNAFRRLEKDGFAGNVESVEYDSKGKVVEVELSIPDPDTYVFDINGNFIAVSD